MWLVFAFLVGLGIGSFVNVIADELARGKTLRQALRRQRSYCNNCKKTLRWYELVPVVSFFVLRAHCLRCGGKIPWRYTLVELVCGMLFFGLAWLYLNGDLTAISAIVSGSIGIFLIILAIVDNLDRAVPDWLLETILFLVVAYLLVTYSLPLDSIFWGLVFAVAVFAPFVFIARGKLMGEADLILAMILGLWLGFPAIVVAIMLSFILGGSVGGFLVLTGRKKRTDRIGFLPFLCLGALVTFFFGTKIINWYLYFVL